MAYSASGFGVFSQSGNTGIISFATGSAGTALIANNVGTGTGLIAAAANGLVIAGTNGPADQDVLSVDTAGNQILAGTLTQNGQPTIRTATSGGKTVAAYSARTSSPTVEDFGEAQLSSGHAYVNLDATFASTIDGHAKYMVFLSPQGDNRGLYVTQISNRGFAVRESNEGHSTLAFDYRIVAKPYDTNAKRLAPTTALSGLVHGRKLTHPLPRAVFTATQQ